MLHREAAGGARPDSSDDLMDQVESLTTENRRTPNVETEQRIRLLRHRAFSETERAAKPLPQLPDAPPVPVDPEIGLPVARGELTPNLVRGAIQSHGSLVVRGLVSTERAKELREAIQATLAARDERNRPAAAQPSPWYDEFAQIRSSSSRAFTTGSGALAADSPRGLFLLLEAFRERGIDRLAGGVLGVRPAVSVEKSVFRCVHPQAYASWHQDGAFLGENIRTLDVWIALTRCGRTAPGLEIFPRRVDRVLPTGAFFDWDLSEEVLQKEYPGVRSTIPEFEVGDAVLFDEFCVHRTGYLPGMTEPRYAIECWLFAPTTFPPGYTALLI